MRLKKFLIISVAGLLISSSLGFGIYSLLRNSNFQPKKDFLLNNKPKKSKNVGSYFPSLQGQDFNSYIKKDEAGNYYLDQQIIMSIMKDLTYRFAVSDGNLEFDYKIIKGLNREDDYLILNVRYIFQNQIETKSYKIYIRS
ncbi:MHO_1590 family protein [Mycoplasmopsis gallopavonis]|uniref:Uncharacterized protein n=1 Tax=Mycoplasmopsis gallopavonis TaxID=76629 RepID=A0A449AZ80_9BACT|nr:hypothetical protein [Mycoplasmopsis gallopavonis]RIV16822.1 hypothetical protein D1113_00835 [Mycoplasmopsis gallopavonis]VEU72811.1 Uncharacterised protein [Mycoplasmopsis gallopavonis]